MTPNQSYLWNRILTVNQDIKKCGDALARWEKSMLLKVLIRELQEEMGPEAYYNLLQSSKQLWASVSPQLKKSH